MPSAAFHESEVQVNLFPPGVLVSSHPAGLGRPAETVGGVTLHGDPNTSTAEVQTVAENTLAVDHMFDAPVIPLPPRSEPLPPRHRPADEILSNQIPTVATLGPLSAPPSGKTCAGNR